MITVHHGTSHVHRPTIHEHGLCPPRGHGAGVRVVMSRAEALRQARAWCAHYLVERHVEPKAIIVTAWVPPARLRNVRGVIRAEYLLPTEIRVTEPAKQWDLVRDLDARARALDLFEQITAPRLKPSGSRTTVRRS